ncbi:MAG: HipA domain-containing protein [Eubacterium sp.]
MNCLCCGKPLRTKEETGWHKACIKHFFMTETLPEIEIDEQALTQLATETIQKGYTVPGVQKKLSLHLFSQTKKPRLTLINYPSGYILKPQVEELYLRLLFSFVVGNSDMHLKNFSLIETEEGSGKYVLSPAMICSRLMLLCRKIKSSLRLP